MAVERFHTEVVRTPDSVLSGACVSAAGVEMNSKSCSTIVEGAKELLAMLSVYSND